MKGKNYKYKSLRRPQKAEVKAIAKRVIRSNEETKYYDLGSGYLNVSTAGVMQVLTTALGQGDSANSRTGVQIHADKLEFRMFHTSGAGQTDIQHVRFILFQDNANTGLGTPTTLDVLSAADPLSPLNQNYQLTKRFRILYDKLVPIGFYKGESMNGFDVQKTIKINRVINWASNTIGSKGQIYFLMIADNVIGGASQNRSYIRLHFRDA